MGSRESVNWAEALPLLPQKQVAGMPRNRVPPLDPPPPPLKRRRDPPLLSLITDSQRPSLVTRTRCHPQQLRSSSPAFDTAGGRQSERLTDWRMPDLPPPLPLWLFAEAAGQLSKQGMMGAAPHAPMFPRRTADAERASKRAQ